MIRIASVKDKDAVVSLAHKFYLSTEYQRIPFCTESVGRMFDAALGQGMCFVSEVNGELVGFIVALSFPSIFNSQYSMAAELAWWVEPEFRGGSMAIRLLREAERAAKDKGVFSLTMICLESMSPDVVQDIYLRLGYAPAERAFIKYL